MPTPTQDGQLACSLSNRSHRSTPDVAYLVAFVESYARHPELVDLYLSSGDSIAGQADAAFRVKIRLSKGPLFPRTSMAVPEIGSVTLYDWREEFVLVLAHELRHVDQFFDVQNRDGDVNLDPYTWAAEIDAENHAVEVLHAYRAALNSLARRAA